MQCFYLHVVQKNKYERTFLTQVKLVDNNHKVQTVALIASLAIKY